jgi:hypothetical protein
MQEKLQVFAQRPRGLFVGHHCDQRQRLGGQALDERRDQQCLQRTDSAQAAHSAVTGSQQRQQARQGSAHWADREVVRIDRFHGAALYRIAERGVGKVK